MSFDQLYIITKKAIDRTGFPFASGPTGVSNARILLIYRLYNSLLNRPPDFPGHCFWCIVSTIQEWDEQTTREQMLIGANFNGELTSGPQVPRGSEINTTPIYFLDDNLNASLIGERKLTFSQDVKDYDTVKTPEGRDVIFNATSGTERSVSEFYNQILGRPPDPEGLQFWIGIYNQWVNESSGTDEQRRQSAAARLVEAFRGSPEFKAHPSNWVNPYYD
jgi:hypothetical protein